MPLICLREMTELKSTNQQYEAKREGLEGMFGAFKHTLTFCSQRTCHNEGKAQDLILSKNSRTSEKIEFSTQFSLEAGVPSSTQLL